MMDLTVIILTKNEEINLAKCIMSFCGAAKRFVVVDSFSTDRTVEIAEKMGAEIVSHPFKNHAEQFNWAIEHITITTEWIMKIDADEELTPELLGELEDKLSILPAATNGIILKRRTYFMGKWLRHGDKYPDLLLRIFRRGHGKSEMKLMDEHLIITDGKTITFTYDLIDNNLKSLTWWIDKHNWYSSKEAQDRQQETDRKNKQESLTGTNAAFISRLKRIAKNRGYYQLPSFLRAHLYFIYRYYFRLGFLDGKEGRIYTFLQAYWYRYLVDAKLYESEKYHYKLEDQGALEAISETKH